MLNSPSCQAWLDAHAIDDSFMADAYEALTGQERAVLKKCIARLYEVWEELPSRQNKTRSFRQGFGLEEDDAPASYVLFVCEASYASPAVFLAALMPALLAGVRTVFSCFCPGANAEKIPPAPLLGALELAGVERAFIAPEEAVLLFAEQLHALSARGRIVLLGRPTFGEKLALHAHRQGILCRSLTQPPFYYSGRLCAVAEQHFMQVDQEAPDNASGSCEDEVDAMFLHLDAAHEDVWFWPKLGPDWFRTRRMRLFAV